MNVSKQELAIVLSLSNEQRGLFLSLRMYCDAHGSLPGEEKAFKKLKIWCGVSAYKLARIWPEIQKFFTFSGGVWTYLEDSLAVPEVPEDVESKLARHDHASKAARQKWAMLRASNEHNEHERASDPPSDSPLPVRQVLSTTSSSSNISTARKDDDAQMLNFKNSFVFLVNAFPQSTPKLLRRLVDAAQSVDAELSDESLLQALQATHRPGVQKSPGMFLEAVPAFLDNQKRVIKKPMLVEMSAEDERELKAWEQRQRERLVHA